jgi:DNA-binding MarR family transcriptional regulator
MTLSEIRHYRRILRRFERVTHAQLKNCCSNVTLAQCLVLLEIEEGGRLTMGQLASRLRLDNSTLSRTIEGLVKGGLVERSREDRDRRVVRIRLTRKGTSTCRSIHEENDEQCRRIFEKIVPSRRAAIVKSFETLVRAYLDAETEQNPQACCDPLFSRVEEKTS